MATKDRYNLKQKSVIVWDRGSYVEIAQRLAKAFGRVMYYMPTASAFMEFNDVIIGTGIEGVERIFDFWKEMPDADFIYFPDVYDGSVAEYLRSIGKPVFGSGYGEEMELDRIGMLGRLMDNKLNVLPHTIVHGITELRKHLQENDDKYIKLSYFRGNFTTFHHETYNLTKPILDEMEHKMGLIKEDIDFLVCDAIDPAVEIGSDLISIDGRYAEKGEWGIEVKDAGFIAKIDYLKNFPKQIIEVNNGLERVLDAYQYKGYISNEIRIGEDGKGYLVDSTNRNPEPPTSVDMLIFKNFPEMVYGAAIGEIVEPETDYKYGVQLIIKSDWATTEPQALYFPEQIKDYVTVKNLCVQDGTYYYVPCHGVEMQEIGAVSFCSNSLEDAILEVKGMAKKIKGYDIDIGVGALDKAMDEIEKLKKFNIIKEF